MNHPNATGPRWMKIALVFAGVYNLVWGASVVLFPSLLFELTGMQLPRYPQIWQCVGMIVGVYGVGYLLAATDPIRHWPITLVGLLGKVFGPIGFLWAFLQGELPAAFGVTLLTNDLIWWIPFAAILYQAFKHFSDRSVGQPSSLKAAAESAVSQDGTSLAELSRTAPTLVVFLRHAGCTFCREMVADLARRRADLEAQGIQIALVHMSGPRNASKFFAKLGVEDLPRFSDPTCELYRTFGLQRGRFWQLFGPRVWLRAAPTALLGRHGIGWLQGDGFQMPGAFLFYRGRLLAQWRAESAADRLDLPALVRSVSFKPTERRNIVDSRSALAQI